MVICYVGVGSNLGDRRKNVWQAIREIGNLENTRIIKTSSFFDTTPVGGPVGQPRFLNGVIKLKTSLQPGKLLEALQRIEIGLGRRRTVCNGPRTIDLDILLFGERFIQKKGLIIPHPRMFERDFVLGPLLEVL